MIISVILREIAKETGSKNFGIGRKKAKRRNAVSFLIHAITSQQHCGGCSVINCIHHLLLIASPVLSSLIHLSHDHFQHFKLQISFPGPCTEVILAVKSKQTHENSILFQLRGKELCVWYDFELSGKCVMGNRKLDALVRVVECFPEFGRAERKTVQPQFRFKKGDLDCSSEKGCIGKEMLFCDSTACCLFYSSKLYPAAVGDHSFCPHSNNLHCKI